MATLAVTNPTLADVAKATDPDGKIATIVENVETFSHMSSLKDLLNNTQQRNNQTS